jgi:preprotein translocase subunit SecA
MARGVVRSHAPLAPSRVPRARANHGRPTTHRKMVQSRRRIAAVRARATTNGDARSIGASASASFDDDELEHASTSTTTAMMSVARDRAWRDGDARQIAELQTRVVDAVRALDRDVRSLTNDELRGKTDAFRARLRAGETLDDILVEAFAVVREASTRELGLTHFDVQLIGGALLHEGWVAEMSTGEGKTLVATLPAYLNALDGKGVHVVTVNDYLAARDATEMGRIYRFLGLTVGVIQSDMTSEERQRAYACDITYVTNTEIGFDYLRDNMANDAEELVVLTRPFNFAIVDEVDSVLIDEGRNPLLITGTGDVNDDDQYVTAAKVAESLIPGRDFKVVLKEKTAELTDEGMLHAEQILGVNDLWDAKNPWGKYILLAVKARALFIKDIDYIVRDGKVIIVDPSTGRVQMNRRWNDNLHQAVEAKEGVEINGENSIIASISYQCLFKLYKKLSGMTGTASTESEEFFTTYNLGVARVPTNKPNLRIDSQTSLFLNSIPRWYAVVDLIERCHAEGRPVLVGTTSVENSEILSDLLSRHRWVTNDGRKIAGVPHELLNARPQYAAREAEIIAQAGRKYAVTIATNMAGRGTDILLGGSPVGLAKRALKEKLWPAFDLGDIGDAALLMYVDLSQEAQITLNQAEHVATQSTASAGSLSEEQAEELLVEALVKAEELLRRGEKPGAWDKDRVLMHFVNVAAYHVLRDCQKQCSDEREEVREVGGLQVIGTSIHDSRRVDNQLRGRAARQGDPGSTVFCVSAEDELLQTYMPGWGNDKLWMFAGVDEYSPIVSDIVDGQLRMVQKQIEDYLSSHRQSTFESDRVLDGQREAVYKLRRQILLSSQSALRERLFKYMARVVDDACERAGVSGNVHPKKWNYEQLLSELRCVFIGRTDFIALTRGLPTGDRPHYLPGVNAVGENSIRDAILSGGDLPIPHEMPPLKVAPAIVLAAIAGVEIVMPEGVVGPLMEDTEPEASDAAINERLRNRLAPPSDVRDSQEYIRRWSKGWHAAKARRLRSYLTESAVQLYLDRFARLAAKDYDRAELESVERLWALRAIDELWQRHLVQMEVLRSSVQVRSFGHLDPKDEFRIDGARAFVSLVESIREAMVKNIFFFIGASVEPTTNFDVDENEDAQERQTQNE